MSPPQVLARGDHVRLSKSDAIPSRYQHVVGEVTAVLQDGRVHLLVPRRREVLTVDASELTKVSFSGARIFPTR